MPTLTGGGGGGGETGHDSKKKKKTKKTIVKDPGKRNVSTLSAPILVCAG